MRVLVTGATGFLGSRITEELTANADVEEIIAAGRKLSSVHEVAHKKVRYALGDLVDTSYVASLLKDPVDHVINCASLSSPWGTQEAFYKANVQTQINLTQACEKSGIKRFIYISSPSIYFNYRNRFNVAEDAPLPAKAANNYAASKLEAEKVLQATSLSYITIRPRAIVGRGDTVIFPRLIRSYHEGKLKVVGSGDNIVDLAAASNVVHAVMLAMTAPDSSCGEAYNICDAAPVKMWEAINYVLRKFDLPPPTGHVPYAIASVAAAFMEWRASLSSSGREPALTRQSVAALALSMTMDTTKAKEKLGYSPRQTTWEAIDEFVDWYKTLSH